MHLQVLTQISSLWDKRVPAVGHAWDRLLPNSVLIVGNTAVNIETGG